MTMMPERENAGAEALSAEFAADRGLLRRYVREQDEVAFRALVGRHLDFVYSVARRRLGGDGHSAADVTQQVFTALARQAAKLPDNVVLPAWLYTTTRHLAANWVRAEQSRRAREHAAHRMNEMNAASPAGAEWESLRPLLDGVLDELAEQDRGAILLRFFSRRSFAEIGAALQLSEDAARMRVERALEKLRAALGRRGVVSTASVLGGLLTENAVTAAPASMVATTVAGVALQGGGVAAAGILVFMTSTKFSLGLAAAAIMAGVAGLVLQPRAESSPAPDPAQHSATAAAPQAANRTVTAVAALQSSTLVARTADSSAGRAHAERLPAAVAPDRDDKVTVAAASVERRVDRLDALVHLTPEQRMRAAALFAKEATILDGIPEQERGEKGMEARVATRKDVRAALTDEQRRKYDISPQSLGGGLPVDPANMVTRLDQAVKLTPQQKQKAIEILWEDVIDQVAALPADQQLKGFQWRDPVRDRLRGILSNEQQSAFDVTPPYRKNR